MESINGLMVHFNDGSKVSYSFPNQADNVFARQIRLEEFLKSDYLIVIADGILTALPVVNIKAIQLPFNDDGSLDKFLPKHVFRGATLTRGEL